LLWLPNQPTMEKLKFLFVIASVMIPGNAVAQDLGPYSTSRLRIETGEGSNKKMGYGYFYAFELTKDKINYTSILVNRELINGSATITFFFKTKTGETPYVMTIPNNAGYVIQDNDQKNKTAAIPYGRLNAELNKENIETDAIFLTEGFLSKYKIPISESDVSKIRELWEAKL
jgi:hypothetical protein